MRRCSTNHIIIAPFPEAALRAGPVLVPDVRAVGHVLPAGLLAHILRGAPFRDVELLQRSQRKVRRTAPSDLRQTRLLALVARLDRIEALFRVPSLVRAHVALHGGTGTEQSEGQNQRRNDF